MTLDLFLHTAGDRREELLVALFAEDKGMRRRGSPWTSRLQRRQFRVHRVEHRMVLQFHVDAVLPRDIGEVIDRSDEAGQRWNVRTARQQDRSPEQRGGMG